MSGRKEHMGEHPLVRANEMMGFSEERRLHVPECISIHGRLYGEGRLSSAEGRIGEEI